MSDTVSNESKVIAVIGSDGPGSSCNSEEFIESATRRSSRRGENFGDSFVPLPYGLMLEGTHVVLLEAPLIKFGETLSSRLGMIEEWLKNEPTGLHGILYLHPNGTTTGHPPNDEDLALIQKLCGTENMTILITGREQYPHSADINEKHIRRMFRRLSDEGTRISHFDRNDTHKILNALISGSNEGSEWTEPSQGRTTTESSPRSISQVLNRVMGDGLIRQSGDRLEDGAKDVEPAPVVEGLEDARRGVDVPNPEIPSLPQEHSLVDQEVSPTSPAIETESHDHPATPAVTGNDGSGNGVSPRGKSSGLERFIFKLTCGLFGSE